MVETGYQTSWNYDYGNNVDYSKLFLLQENALHMVVNDPDQSTYYDMFFSLESDNSVGTLTTEITSVWSKEYTTISDALYGAPTRKLYMLEGWADDNIL
jgi:hypothetical protein